MHPAERRSPPPWLLSPFFIWRGQKVFFVVWIFPNMLMCIRPMVMVPVFIFWSLSFVKMVISKLMPGWDSEDEIWLIFVNNSFPYDLKKLLWWAEFNPRVHCAFGNVSTHLCSNFKGPFFLVVFFWPSLLIFFSESEYYSGLAESVSSARLHHQVVPPLNEVFSETRFDSWNIE